MWMAWTSKRRCILLILGGIGAGGGAFSLLLVMLYKDPVEETVYVKNVPYTWFLGHVIESHGTITLAKTYPLYEYDRHLMLSPNATRPSPPGSHIDPLWPRIVPNVLHYTKGCASLRPQPPP